MQRKYKVAVVCTLQVILLLAIIVFKYQTLLWGTPVLLKTEPVDPWDMLRGEYVRLNYEISGIKLDDVDNRAGSSSEFTYRQKVFVVLEQDGRYWRATALHKDKPPIAPGQVVIKARVNYYDEYTGELRVFYGIESYYVPEGQGRELERSRHLDVTIMVDRFGNAVITKVTTT